MENDEVIEADYQLQEESLEPYVLGRFEKVCANIYGSVAILRFVTWVIYGVFFIALLVNKTEWAIYSITPVSIFFNLLGLAIAANALVMCCFEKARLLAGALLVVSGYMFLFTTHIAAAIMTFMYTGKLGLIVGTVIAGYGVIPLSLFSSGIRQQWMMFGNVAGGTIMAILALYFGYAVYNKSVNQRITLHLMFPEIQRDRLQYEAAMASVRKRPKQP